MTLETNAIKSNSKKFNLRSISYLIACFAVLYYPHTVFGGILIDGKTMIQILLFASFFLYAFSRFASNERLLDPSPISKPLAAAVILVFITVFFAQNKPLALEAFLFLLAYLGCFYIFLSLFNQEKNQVILVYGICGITLFLCLRGLVEFHLWNQKLDHFFRLRATFGNSNLMAGWLVMTIPLFTGLILSRKFRRPVFILLIMALMTMIISLFFTFARGGWIGTFTGLSFILAFHFITKRKKKSKLIFPVISVTLLILLFFISSTDLVKRFSTMTQQETEMAFNGRLQWARAATEMIKTNPITGVGPGNYASAITTFEPPRIGRRFFAHNDYLQFISETGILLVPVLLWLIFAQFKHGISKLNNSTYQIRGITVGALGGMVAILVYGLGDYNLHIAANIMLFTVLAAIVAAPISEKKTLKNQTI